MQGYILKIQKMQNEDLMVFLLSQNKFIRAYRFYGARHPIITQGYKIDFELEISGVFLPKIHSPLHLSFAWLEKRENLIIWQQFMRLMYDHLKDSNEIESFYFELLEICSHKLFKQNPKRVIIEAYLELLDFEGRLHRDFSCFLCDEIISQKVSLARSFMPIHDTCGATQAFDLDIIKKLFNSKSTIEIDDEMINSIYLVLLQGL